MYNSNSQGFIRRKGIPVDTVRRVYRRYLKFEPGHAEEYIEFLKECGNWNEVANHLANTVDDDNFQSLAGKSKHQMWLELCDVITKHPSEVTAVDVDSILRSGIRRFSDEVVDSGLPSLITTSVVGFSRRHETCMRKVFPP